jgi:hypothetical protein
MNPSCSISSTTLLEVTSILECRDDFKDVIDPRVAQFRHSRRRFEVSVSAKISLPLKTLHLFLKVTIIFLGAPIAY